MARRLLRVVDLYYIGAFLGALACQEANLGELVEIDGQGQEIIGGFPAEGRALDAIGVVGWMQLSDDRPAAPIVASCSGTLIAETTVVAAKHCIGNYAVYSNQSRIMVFAIGSDIARPKRWSRVVEVRGAPGDRGGFLKIGHDVAVLHLEEPIRGIAFPRLGSLDEHGPGARFVSIGYGRPDNFQHAGKRRAGAGRLKAKQGRVHEALLGSFEAYFQNTYGVHPAACDATEPGASLAPAPASMAGSAAPLPIPSPCTQLSELRHDYDTTLLETAGEVVVAVDRGDAQPCKGDSGGPLIRSDEAGELVTYGVTSGGKSSRDQLCDFGSVYATFMHEEVMEFVERAKSWTDPCAELPSRGVCDGSIARRCSTPAEGQRRLLAFDCQSLGLGCAVADDGTVGCD